MDDRRLRIIAAVGLAVGGVFGIGGTFAPTEALRGLAWGLDGVSLIVASALLCVWFFRAGHDFIAAGFLVFAVGQGLVTQGAAMELLQARPSFGAGVGVWAAALVLISLPRYFPIVVRVLGVISAVMFGLTAARIFAGAPLVPISEPLPSYAYPVFVATFAGWIWTLLKRPRSRETER